MTRDRFRVRVARRHGTGTDRAPSPEHRSPGHASPPSRAFEQTYVR